MTDLLRPIGGPCVHGQRPTLCEKCQLGAVNAESECLLAEVLGDREQAIAYMARVTEDDLSTFKLMLRGTLIRAETSEADREILHAAMFYVLAHPEEAKTTAAKAFADLAALRDNAHDAAVAVNGEGLA